MKSIYLSILMLFSGFIFAQTNKTDGTGSLILNNVFLGANGNTNFGSAATFYNPDPQIEGTVYLYDDWKNKAIIYTADRKFSVPNMNLNLERNTFESKFGRDSLFTFNFNNIDRFVINNKVFKNFYHDGENKVFQELYNGNGIQIYKYYKLKLIKGSDNPMLSRSKDKYIKRSYYVVKKDNALTSLKLKRKELMKYVADKEQADKILAFVKKQGK